MKIFISSAHNEPSGGTKVINDVVNLFREKGVEAYMVMANPTVATFLDTPTPHVLSFKDVRHMCSQEDSIIDCWQSEEAWETAQQAPAHQKIFWQHGASLPTGHGVRGADIFGPDSPYTAHWNVSAACAAYIQKTYSVDSVSIIHPFFDTTCMTRMMTQQQHRQGFLVLQRRGVRHIQALKQKLGNDLTMLEPPFHEKDLYTVLSRHRFLVSIDDGVRDMSKLNKCKEMVKLALSPSYRKKQSQRSGWIIPQGNLLGFPMPPVEAAWLGCGVIGFAMGGGLEWMTEENCFLAKDGDQQSLLEQVDFARTTGDEVVQKKIDSARVAVRQFTKEHTWQQLTAVLNLENV